MTNFLNVNEAAFINSAFERIHPLSSELSQNFRDLKTQRVFFIAQGPLNAHLRNLQSELIKICANSYSCVLVQDLDQRTPSSHSGITMLGKLPKTLPIFGLTKGTDACAPEDSVAKVNLLFQQSVLVDAYLATYQASVEAFAPTLSRAQCVDGVLQADEALLQEIQQNTSATSNPHLVSALHSVCVTNNLIQQNTYDGTMLPLEDTIIEKLARYDRVFILCDEEAFVGNEALYQFLTHRNIRFTAIVPQSYLVNKAEKTTFEAIQRLEMVQLGFHDTTKPLEPAFTAGIPLQFISYLHQDLISAMTLAPSLEVQFYEMQDLKAMRKEHPHLFKANAVVHIKGVDLAIVSLLRDKRDPFRTLGHSRLILLNNFLLPARTAIKHITGTQRLDETRSSSDVSIKPVLREHKWGFDITSSNPFKIEFTNTGDYYHASYVFKVMHEMSLTSFVISKGKSLLIDNQQLHDNFRPLMTRQDVEWELARENEGHPVRLDGCLTPVNPNSYFTGASTVLVRLIAQNNVTLSFPESTRESKRRREGTNDDDD